MNVQEYLTRHQVDFGVISHRPTYDAQRMAQAVHTSGHDVAKTVLLRADRGFTHVVAVLPADKQIDFAKASAALGGAKLELATEIEIAEHCPDCEFGALPPFGSEYGMKTIVERSLTEDEEIVFEGNRHDEAIRMKYADYRQLETPMVADFAA